MEISIVIPTYGRESVLLDTVSSLLDQCGTCRELLVVDQTREHTPETEVALATWSKSNVIRWIRLESPSVTHAMNRGLLDAKAPLVLFLDDDIQPAEDLVDQHVVAHSSVDCELIAGRVIQPGDWHKPADPASLFNSPNAGSRAEFMGGNFSVRRDNALALGGFDENFRYSAYQFEREFSDRLIATGGCIHFAPNAWIRHLQAASGGVRSFGSHLTTAGPGHSQGAYYYILSSEGNCIRKSVHRLFRSIGTRYHLHRPWCIPRTLVAEMRGMVEAMSCKRKGKKLLQSPAVHNFSGKVTQEER